MQVLPSSFSHPMMPSPPSSFSSSSSPFSSSSSSPFSSSSSSSPTTFDDLSTPVSMGTTIMALSFAGGVVLGADSRTSTGSYVANRVSDKISPLATSIYCCRSGSAADTQAISEIVRYYLAAHREEHGDEPEVKTAATLCRDLCYQNKDRLLAGILIGGWDKKRGGQVYALPLGGTLVEQPFALGGSGSTYIYGLVDAEYRRGMARAECEALVKKAVSHAMARDGSSGGIIRLVTIDETGVTKQYVPAQELPFSPEDSITGGWKKDADKKAAAAMSE